MAVGDLPVQWQLAGQTLSGYDSYGCRWITQKSRGWRGTSKPRTDRNPRTFGSGSTRGVPYYDERIITLEGVCKAPTPAARADAEERIGQLFGDNVRMLELVRVGENGVSQSRMVELDEADDPVPHGRVWMDWALQVAAPDPRKYATSWVSGQVLRGSPGTGGLTIPLTATAPGLVAGTSPAPATVVARNTGTALMRPVLQLTGGLDLGATVIEVETGVQLVYTVPIDPGTSLWINCDDHPVQLPDSIVAGGLYLPGRSVLLGGLSNRRAQLITSGWPGIPGGGSRTYLLSGASATGGAPALTVHHRAAWN